MIGRLTSYYLEKSERNGILLKLFVRLEEQ
jgi:hypothetical protein